MKSKCMEKERHGAIRARNIPDRGQQTNLTSDLIMSDILHKTSDSFCRALFYFRKVHLLVQ